MNNLHKFRSRRNDNFVAILIFLLFSKSGIQCLWQGKISVFKVLVSIKVVPVKMIISFIQNSNCIDISK